MARRVPAATAPTRNLVGQPGFPGARRPIHPSAQREPRLHRPALHDRRRGRRVLAVAAAVAALGFLRDAGTPADVLALAGRAGLDQTLRATPRESCVDRTQR